MRRKQPIENETKREENVAVEIDQNEEFKIPEIMSKRRLCMFLLIVVATTVLCVGLAVLAKCSILKMCLYLMIEVVFLSIFLYGVEFARLHKKLLLGKINKYERITIVCAASCFLTLVSYFLPSYTALFVPMAIALGTVATEVTACAYIGFLNLLLCMIGQRSMEEMAAYMLLIILASLLVPAFADTKLQKIAGILLILENEMVLILFSFLEYGSFQPFVCITSLLIAEAAAYLMQMPKLRRRMFPDWRTQEQIACLAIIQESYELVKEMKQYSKKDFEHAKKVSQIAYQCADFLHVDAPLAMAGGFYYCVGHLEGEPYIQNGVELAVSLDFPENVTRILSEYNGELKKPSSKESAIVHIVNCIVTEIEKVQEKETVWDNKILIYQVFNQYSNSGIYDESGLSINQYLRLREFLAKKEEMF
ncbi:MAG: hypothetical protein ACI4HI_11135 [Lachnospiraceae bacterium]